MFWFFPVEKIFFQKSSKTIGEIPDFFHKGVLQISTKNFGNFPDFFRTFFEKIFFDQKKSKNFDRIFLKPHLLIEEDRFEAVS